MEQKEEDEFGCALLLLFSAERTMVKRKVYEATHNGLTVGLFENPLILIEIQKFLSTPEIRERLEKLLRN